MWGVGALRRRYGDERLLWRDATPQTDIDTRSFKESTRYGLAVAATPKPRKSDALIANQSPLLYS